LATPTPIPEGPRTPTNQPADINNEDPWENPFLNQPTPNLAEAIMLMTHELTRREAAPKVSKAKMREPDTFDGSDPSKLSNFILLCNLYFRNNPAYSDDEAKIAFALSHLRGTALESFEPSILAENHEDWMMDNWSDFVESLQNQFGPMTPLQMLRITLTT